MSVIELRKDISAEALFRDVMEHIYDYQELVDRKRETAERLLFLEVRMKNHKKKMIEEYEV